MIETYAVKYISRNERGDEELIRYRCRTSWLRKWLRKEPKETWEERYVLSNFSWLYKPTMEKVGTWLSLDLYDERSRQQALHRYGNAF